jgi:hypothetical protein
VAIALSKAFGLAGVDTSGMSVGYPVTPQETGISIRVADLSKIPDSAIKVAEAIKKITGVEPRFTPYSREGSGFSVFVGTNPNEN